MNQYSVVAQERTASAQRADEVRKRLLESARETDAEESRVTLAGWPGGGGGPRREQGQENSRGTRSDEVEVSDAVAEPISVWA